MPFDRDPDSDDITAMTGDPKFIVEQTAALQQLGYRPDRNPAILAAAREVGKTIRTAAAILNRGCIHSQTTTWDETGPITIIHINGQPDQVIRGHSSILESAATLGRPLVRQVDNLRHAEKIISQANKHR